MPKEDLIVIRRANQKAAPAEISFDFILDRWNAAAADLQATGDLILVRLPYGFYGGIVVKTRDTWYEVFGPPKRMKASALGPAAAPLAIRVPAEPLAKPTTVDGPAQQPRNFSGNAEDLEKLRRLDQRAMAGDQDAGLEAALLARVARGDQEAFEALFRRFERPLYAFCVRMLGDEPTAEDLVCQTMTAVWKDARGFRGEARVSTWIFGIAHKLAAAAIRRRRPVGSLEEADSMVAPGNPEESAVQADMGERVRRALATLSPDHREVVELTFFHGMSYREIAMVLGISVNTVKTRMFYARQKLKTALIRVGIADAN